MGKEEPRSPPGTITKKCFVLEDVNVDDKYMRDELLVTLGKYRYERQKCSSFRAKELNHLITSTFSLQHSISL